MDNARVILRSGESFVMNASVSTFVREFRRSAEGMDLNAMLADETIGFMIRISDVAAIVPESWRSGREANAKAD